MLFYFVNATGTKRVFLEMFNYDSEFEAKYYAEFHSREYFATWEHANVSLFGVGDYARGCMERFKAANMPFEFSAIPCH